MRRGLTLCSLLLLLCLSGCGREDTLRIGVYSGSYWNTPNGDCYQILDNAIARFQEEQYDELDGPVVRIAALDVPMPYNIPMEKHAIPDVERICASIRAMMK